MTAPRAKPLPDELTLTAHCIGAFMGRSRERSAVAATDEIRRLYATAKWASKQTYSPTRTRRNRNKHGRNNPTRVDVYQTPYAPKQWVFYVRGKVLLTVHGPFEKKPAPAPPEESPTASRESPAGGEAVVGQAVRAALTGLTIQTPLPPIPQPRCAVCGMPVEQVSVSTVSRVSTIRVKCHGAEQVVELDARDAVWLDRLEFGEAFSDDPLVRGVAPRSASS
jgi:hypothetical protein